MKQLFFLFFLFFFQKCFSYEYFCSFEKKVDAISFVESSEIENDSREENQDILKLINSTLLLQVFEYKIKQIVKVNEIPSIVNYTIIKNNDDAVTAVSKKNNFILFFKYSDLKLVFSEFYDASHVANYFYSCKR